MNCSVWVSLLEKSREFCSCKWQHWSTLRALPTTSFVLIFTDRGSLGYENVFYGLLHRKQFGTRWFRYSLIINRYLKMDPALSNHTYLIFYQNIRRQITQQRNTKCTLINQTKENTSKSVQNDRPYAVPNLCIELQIQSLRKGAILSLTIRYIL